MPYSSPLFVSYRSELQASFLRERCRAGDPEAYLRPTAGKARIDNFQGCCITKLDHHSVTIQRSGLNGAPIAKSGNYVWDFYLAVGDPGGIATKWRASFTHPQTFRAGDVRWYHWDIYVPSLEFPAKVPGGMDYTVDSFHDKRSSGVGSYVVFNIMNNRGPVVRVHLLPGILQYEATPLLCPTLNSPYNSWRTLRAWPKLDGISEIERDQWVSWTAHIKWSQSCSANPSDLASGYVYWYKNGVMVFEYHGPTMSRLWWRICFKKAGYSWHRRARKCIQ